MHAMKADVMTEWAKYLFKLAVLRDVFEAQEIGNLLRERTSFKYSNNALYQYLRGERQPPANFFDYARVALGLTQDEYQTLLFLYHRSDTSPTPHQEEQMRYFRDVLMRRILDNLGGPEGNHLGGAGAAG